MADLTGFDATSTTGFSRAATQLYARAHRRIRPASLDAARRQRVERWRRAEIPAVNGHGTARAVAGLSTRALACGRLLSPRAG